MTATNINTDTDNNNGTDTDNTANSFTFDNAFVRELPADPNRENYSRQIEGAAYSLVAPQPTAAPQLLAYSADLADMLDIASSDLENDTLTAMLSGNEILEGMEPYAMCYGGHQFGNWAGQLGDGRAINLGEIINSKGQRWALQLKGAGPTPYSRSADGRAVLRSSVREFLCSEAMFHLGVPTTRALSLCLTGDEVMRDMFYSGNPQNEPGAVVCRVAPSFIRFGNFQIFAMRGDTENLQELADFCIRTDYPQLLPENGEIDAEIYLQWLSEIAERTALMIVEWMRVGFVHGVMNTDNMSILGLTIDYGPYGWLEPFDTTWTPNTTDAQHGRYSFGQQMHISTWNMMQLINAIFPLSKNQERSQEILDSYQMRLGELWKKMMADKLGLAGDPQESDNDLFHDLLEILELQECDYCIFFRLLSGIPIPAEGDSEQIFAHIQDAYYLPQDSACEATKATGNAQQRMRDWLQRYSTRLADDSRSPQERQREMNAVNPKYVLRNYLAQQAIEKSETGDHSMISELLEVLRHPYDEQSDKEIFAGKRPEWARSKPGCSSLSCSS